MSELLTGKPRLLEGVKKMLGNQSTAAEVLFVSVSS